MGNLTKMEGIMERANFHLENLAVPQIKETAEENASIYQKPECKTCKGIGYEEIEIDACIPNPTNRKIKKRVRCTECEERAFQKRQRDIENQKEAEKDEDIKKVIYEQTTCVPKRFSSAKLSSCKASNLKQKEALYIMQDKPMGSYFLCGDYGSGKTHLLYAQYAEIINGDRVLYVTSMHNLLEIFRRESLGENDHPYHFLAISSGSEETHVFIDDIDKFKITDFKLEALFDFIDTIYRQNVALTVTSNMTLAELQEKLSPAICRRLDDICRVIML